MYTFFVSSMNGDGTINVVLAFWSYIAGRIVLLEISNRSPTVHRLSYAVMVVNIYLKLSKYFIPLKYLIPIKYLNSLIKPFALFFNLTRRLGANVIDQIG